MAITRSITTKFPRLQWVGKVPYRAFDNKEHYCAEFRCGNGGRLLVADDVSPEAARRSLRLLMAEKRVSLTSSLVHGMVDEIVNGVFYEKNRS